MSRVGKIPVDIPKGVKVEINKNLVVVKGPKGQLDYQAPMEFTLKLEDDKFIVERPDDSNKNRALHGLVRTLVRNMVVGVSEGYLKKLEIVGVGYKVVKQGNGIQINVGYSHPVVFEEKDGIEFDVPNQTTIVVKGIDRQAVGQVAANIRSVRPPEPYKGKGIKYADEVIRRKVGKAGA